MTADAALWVAAEGRVHVTEEGGAAPAKLLVEEESRILLSAGDAQLQSVRMRVGPSWEWTHLRIPVQGFVAWERQDDGHYSRELRFEGSPTALLDIGDIDVSDRNRFELGFRSGDFVARYENRLRVRLQPASVRVWPYAEDALRLDIRTGLFDENRAVAGVALKVAREYRLEIAGILRTERRDDGDFQDSLVLSFRLVVTDRPNRD